MRDLKEILLNEIRNEADRSEVLHGNQDDLSRLQWYAILSEEVGEVARALCDTMSRDPDKVAKAARNMREELVQVASVALRMLDIGDRCEWWRA